MGEARRRGTFEQRKAQAIAEGRDLSKIGSHTCEKCGRWIPRKWVDSHNIYHATLEKGIPTELGFEKDFGRKEAEDAKEVRVQAAE